MAREEQLGGELRTAFLQKVLNKLLITAPPGPPVPQQPLPDSYTPQPPTERLLSGYRIHVSMGCFQKHAQN